MTKFSKPFFGFEEQSKQQAWLLSGVIHKIKRSIKTKRVDKAQDQL